jgi:hypothetical protein
VFCPATSGRATDEHVIPKWAREGFAIQGWLTVHRADPGAELKQIGRLQHLNIVLKGGLCEACNNKWLGPVENRAKAILLPMAISATPTTLGAAEQALVSFWAIKTAFLLELAFRQKYPNRAFKGYAASEPEMAWLRQNDEPPPRAMVWLGCWDCRREVPVRYEPSRALLPTADGTELTGHLATLTLGFVALQVYSVNFVRAELHGAPVWNTRPPEPLRTALPRIWPPQLVTGDVSWPPAAFPHDGWRQLVTWDEVLRSGSDHAPPGR